MMFAGAGIALYAACTPGAIVARVACGGIGVAGLLMAFIFSIASLRTFMRLSPPWSQRTAHDLSFEVKPGSHHRRKP
ncbi:MAG TPA: hypothetical protein VGY56_03630 [Verrucomicrobiae bacterium]|nr:hypothetical protein [Verrucomicrobiae bacterium]